MPHRKSILLYVCVCNKRPEMMIADRVNGTHTQTHTLYIIIVIITMRRCAGVFLMSIHIYVCVCVYVRTYNNNNAMRCCVFVVFYFISEAVNIWHRNSRHYYMTKNEIDSKFTKLFYTIRTLYCIESNTHRSVSNRTEQNQFI